MSAWPFCCEQVRAGSYGSEGWGSPSERDDELADKAHAVCILDASPTSTHQRGRVHLVSLRQPGQPRFHVALR